jgi:hypothetical protein
MRDAANSLRCDEFQSNLPYIIGSGKKISEHSHVQSCELCRALLADLDVIAQAARKLFPIHDPPATLWGHIESAIAKQEAVHKH